MPDRCLPVRQRVSMISSIEGIESVGDAEDAVDATEATEQLDPEVVVNGRAAGVMGRLSIVQQLNGKNSSRPHRARDSLLALIETAAVAGAPILSFTDPMSLEKCSSQ